MFLQNLSFARVWEERAATAKALFINIEYLASSQLAAAGRHNLIEIVDQVPSWAACWSVDIFAI